MKTLILGLGNPIVRDDALGLIVAERVAQEVEVDVLRGSLSGLRLLDSVTGYDRVIIVDATQTGEDRPGTVHRHELAALATGTVLPTPHRWGIAEALAFGRQAGMEVPSQVVVYTMEAGDLSDFGEGLSPQVEAAIAGMVQRIVGEQFRQPPADPTSNPRGEQCQTG